MKKLSLQSLFIFAIILMVLQGCSKKDDSGPAGPSNSNTPPSAPTVQFKGPQTSSQDPYAQMTVTYATMFNGLSGLFAPFASGSGTSSGNTWTWSATYGSMTVTYTATRQTDGSYTWRCVYNGTDNGHVYSNFVAWEGSTNAAGNGGSWRVYDDNTTSPNVKVAEYVWSTDASGIITGTFTGYDNGVVSGRYVVTNNPNNSGEVDFYDGTVLVFKAVWTANGAGTWYLYNSSTGAQESTGTWS